MLRDLQSGDYINQRYKIAEEIDDVKGSLARVYGAQELKGEEREVAFKVLRCEHLELAEQDRAEKYEAFNREAELLQLLRDDERVMDLYEVGYLWETSTDESSHQYQSQNLTLNVKEFRALQAEAVARGWRPYLVLKRYPRTHSLQYLLGKKGRDIRLPMIEAVELSLQLIDLAVKLHTDAHLHPDTIIYWDAKPAHAYWDGQKLVLIDWNVSYPLTPENRRRAGGGPPDDLKELDILILGRKLIYPAFIGREFQGKPVESLGTPFGNKVRELHAFFYQGEVSLQGYEEKLDPPVRNFLTRVVQSNRFKTAQQLQQSLQYCAIQLGWQFGDQEPTNGLAQSLEHKKKVITHLRTAHQALDSALQELRQFERVHPGEDTRYLSQKVRELFKSSDIPQTVLSCLWRGVVRQSWMLRKGMSHIFPSPYAPNETEGFIEAGEKIMTYAELEERVEKLRQAENVEQAVNEVNQFMLEDHGLEEISKAEQLLISLENEQQSTLASGPAADGFTTDLAIVRSELDIGEVEHAFDGVERLLREQPNHPDVQALLRDIVGQDVSMRARAENLLEELNLDKTLLDQPPPPPVGLDPSARQSAPASSAATSATFSDPLFEKYQEAMRLYRTRYHDQAIELFEEVLHKAEPGSQLHQDAGEYRQKAEERLLAGEVPLDNIPYTAVDKQSQATSAIRLGDYESSIKLLDAAIQACLQAKVRYPPEWNSQFQSAREIHMAYKVKEKGDIALANGNLEVVRQHWTNAQKVLEDAELEQSLQDLQAAKKAVTDGEILARTLTGPSNEQQIKDLLKVLQDLQKARAAFPQVPIVEETLSTVQRQVFKGNENLTKLGENYLAEAQQANTLADRRRWLESAIDSFKLGQMLSGETVTDPNMNRAQQMLQSQGDLENQLQEAETLLHENTGDAADLATITNYLRDVKDVVPNDTMLRAFSRRLRDQYLEHAERKLSDPSNGGNLRQAEEYIRIADSEFFGSPTERLNTLKTRLLEVKQARRRKALIFTIIAAGAALLIITPLAYAFSSRVVQPIVAPTSTPTATATATPTSTATATATATVTPTPTQTPIILYGSVRSQVWVYDIPSEADGQRISFVLQNQPVEVVETTVNDQGEEWHKIRWTSRDSRNEGWIQADRVLITGTN